MGSFSFANANGLTIYVNGSDYNDTGTWSANGTYMANRLDVSVYATTQYICIRDNIGDNPRRAPTRTRPATWSIISQIGSTATNVETFWTGTVTVWVTTDRPGEYQTGFN